MHWFEEDRPIFRNSPSPEAPPGQVSRERTSSPALTGSNRKITASTLSILDPGLAVLRFPVPEPMEVDPEVLAPNSTATPHSGFAGMLDTSALEARAAAAIAETESEESASGAKAQRVDSAQGGTTGIQELSSASRSPPTVLPRAITPPPREAAPVSPCTERLPSFRQLTGQLSELAEAAASQEPRARAYSTTSQSPRLRYHHSYPGSTQTSPVRPYDPARSPTHHGSPPRHHPTAYYADRRTSVMVEPPPMLSASSSCESRGYGSSIDGYSTSTAQTTPIEQPPVATQRPILPPPHGMPASAVILHTGFRCEHSGCDSEFPTQYLLSSHRNVHSSSRPHYCPVQDCVRGEGGKGFKRKNEMIRHGLVHNSPGYVCPFCRDPERQHTYPRPDNLIRHVKKHHPDKDRDDTTLRDVLAQRIEGSSKSRKRRTTFSE